jgi:hypothetical protein
MFSYQICDSVIDTSNISPVVHAKTATTPVNPFDAQNNDTITRLPMVVGQNNNILPIVVEPIEATIDLPIVVEPIEAKTIHLPIVVEPIEAKTIHLPIVVEPIEAENKSKLPIVAETIVAKSNTDLSIEVEHDSVVSNEANIENQIWFINYGKELQGLIITRQEVESHYYDIHTALLNFIVILF